MNSPLSTSPTLLKRRSVLVAVAAAFALAGAGAAWWRIRLQAPSEQAVSMLMQLDAPDANNQTLRLGQFAGKTLVVNFWATWCAPCVEEMPELSGMQREFSAHDIQILGIGVDSARNVSQFAQKGAFAYPLVATGSQGLELLRLLGNTSGVLPYTVVIDRKGRIVERTLGRIDAAKLRSVALKTAGA